MSNAKMLTMGVLLAAGIAVAQEPRVRIMTNTFQMAVPPGPGGPFEFGGHTVDFVKSEMAFDMKVVKGAPYSAEAVTESTQVLADGNRIRRNTKALMYRDSQGRTRREQTLGEVGPLTTAGEPLRTIFIHDPVAGVSYMLNSREHMAHKIMGAGEARGRIEMQIAKAKEEGARVSKEKRDVIFHTELPATGESRGTIGGIIAQTELPAKKWMREQVKEETLPVQTIEGVLCDGTRSTMTIPAGAIGNERPIEVVTERWYSPQLQTTVMTKTTDPRFGETVYRLSNIRLDEPAESLFTVPADYSVK